MSKYSPEFMTHTSRESVNLATVKKAIKSNSILESRVIKCNENNDLTVEIGKNIFGIIPFNEVEYHPDNSPIKVASATSKINKHIKYMPIDFHIEDDGTVIVNCSRKAVQKMCYENYISKLSVGDIIDAHVMKIVGYGIFCDIGCGIIALLPTNSISVTHIVNPMVELKGISTLKVIVKAIREDGKIELTHKELLGTWKEQIAQFAEGDLVKGTVLSVEDYGVFIRLSQNLSGLAEVPEGLELNSGDTVSVRIQSIQDKNMKVKLSIVEKIEDNEDKTIRFKYYVNEPHITDWVYSTETAKKQISSHFE